jgi:3-phenylpropionate/trans-cinnamate dioxygenase ferredoxin subunit
MSGPGRPVVVAAADEIPAGGRKIVEIDGRSIGVFNLGDAYVAIRNACPHEGAPLCEGVLSGALTSPFPGVYRYERRGQILRCPWHQWEFDVRTGRSWVDPERLRVRSYRVTTNDAHVVVHV